MTANVVVVRQPSPHASGLVLKVSVGAATITTLSSSKPVAKLRLEAGPHQLRFDLSQYPQQSEDVVVPDDGVLVVRVMANPSMAIRDAVNMAKGREPSVYAATSLVGSETDAEEVAANAFADSSRTAHRQLAYWLWVPLAGAVYFLITGQFALGFVLVAGAVLSAVGWWKVTRSATREDVHGLPVVTVLTNPR